MIEFIGEKEKSIEGKVRILVRASGTEPLIRVMVEAETLEIVYEYTEELMEKVRLLLT